MGKLHYLIKLDDGRDWKRHLKQIQKIGEATPTMEDSDWGPPPQIEEEDDDDETSVQEPDDEVPTQEESFYEDASD